jgi:3-hydroxybutyryl-CoA dehydrogenase
MTALDQSRTIGVIGAGTMGAGIAQVAAAAGHLVRLFDAQPGAAEQGRARARQGLDALAARGRMASADVAALVDRITVAPDIDALGGCALVVEAIVENIDVKRTLFAQLEAVLDDDAILATNTSSISISSIASTCRRPDRVVGMHFFNPAPVMKLVEVVSGLATASAVADCVFATATAWGKIAVHTRSTPGFIVNRVARPYYAEALRLVEEGVADPATIDTLLVGAGFRMGPFALMDLIGNDVNYAVTRSVYDAYYQDPRFRPSLVQHELVEAGRLGRKSGRGFFDYAADARPLSAKLEPIVAATGIADFAWDGQDIHDDVLIAMTDGRPARDRAIAEGRPVLLYDLPVAGASAAIGFTTSPDVPRQLVDRFVATLSARDIGAVHLPDWPGLVTMRTVAMLGNEAFEAVMHGVATEDGVDAAMRFGVNYPRGPLAWIRQLGLDRVLGVLDHLRLYTGDPRYRASLGLRNAAGTVHRDLARAA